MGTLAADAAIGFGQLGLAVLQVMRVIAEVLGWAVIAYCAYVAARLALDDRARGWQARTPGGPEVGDDTLAMLGRHRRHDDTAPADGITAELRQLLGEEGQ